jgi:hypothetical protein
VLNETLAVRDSRSVAKNIAILRQPIPLVYGNAVKLTQRRLFVAATLK